MKRAKSLRIKNVFSWLEQLRCGVLIYYRCVSHQRGVARSLPMQPMEHPVIFVASSRRRKDNDAKNHLLGWFGVKKGFLSRLFAALIRIQIPWNGVISSRHPPFCSEVRGQAQAVAALSVPPLSCRLFSAQLLICASPHTSEKQSQHVSGPV